MKKTVIFLLCVIQIIALFGLSAEASGGGMHWYCVHVKDHVQPRVGKDLAFVEELDGYYIDRINTSPDAVEKVVYLTFDAGYENGNVEKILNVLQEENVTAAFFVLGHLISAESKLVERMANEGHLVCNHTVHHKNMTKCTEEEFLKELQELEKLYSDTTGKQMAKYYRPPEGSFSQENLEWAQQNGYKTIFWSFAYPDWDNEKQIEPQKAKQIILDNAHNGEVMLLHPTSATNAAILKDVIRELKAQGYRFGTLDELTCEQAE